MTRPASSRFASAADLGFERAASALDHLRIAAYCFLAETTVKTAFPRYLGSTLRGGLGHALRTKVCLTGLTECATCPLRARCLYPYAFETQLTLPRAAPIRGDVPRPFILVPGPAGSPLEPGERFSFGLTLMGSAAIGALPYFVHAVERFGEHGIGRRAAPFRLIRVERLRPGQDPVAVWVDGRLTGAAVDDGPTTGAEIARSWMVAGISQATVRFLTPARFKAAGRFVSEPPPFSVLIGRLLDRLEGISVIHHGTELAVDFHEWRRRAEEIRLVEADVSWHDWTRYSSRQRTEMQMGGLLGSVTYAGNLSQFLPLLGVGEWLHVGKGTTFGLGRYTIELPGREGGAT